MLEQLLSQLLTNSPMIGVTLLAVWQLWQRTAKTLDRYEATLDVYVNQIIITLNRIDERTTQCHKPTNDTTSRPG